MNTKAASTIRRGLNLGRLMAVEACLTRASGEPYEGWRKVDIRTGIYWRTFWRAVDRGAELEMKRNLYAS